MNNLWLYHPFLYPCSNQAIHYQSITSTTLKYTTHWDWFAFAFPFQSTKPYPGSCQNRCPSTPSIQTLNWYTSMLTMRVSGTLMPMNGRDPASTSTTRHGAPFPTGSPFTSKESRGFHRFWNPNHGFVPVPVSKLSKTYRHISRWQHYPSWNLLYQSPQEM